MKYKFSIDITLKNKILDPQGQAVMKSAHLLHFDQITEIRMGKHINITVEAENKSRAYNIVKELTEKLLYNPIIEEHTITFTGEEE